MLSPPVPFNRHVLALRREVGVVKEFKRERAATWREKKISCRKNLTSGKELTEM